MACFYCRAPSQFWNNWSSEVLRERRVICLFSLCSASQCDTSTSNRGYKQTQQHLQSAACHNSPYFCEGGGVEDEWTVQEQEDATALLDSISACARQKDLFRGSRVHAHILKSGLFKSDAYVSTALIRMYAKCDALAKAQELFDELPIRDVVSWTTLISGYAKQGLGVEALKYFMRMLDDGVSPDDVTFVCVLKACGNIRAAEKGEDIHAKLHSLGLLEKNIMLGNALVDMYAKCGKLVKAQQVFSKLPTRDIVSWTALITGYAQNGLAVESLKCLGSMRGEGLFPDAVTFICILNACSKVGALDKGEEIHAEVTRQGLLEKNVALGNALIDMYAKCHVLAKAQEVFDDLPARDIVSWNVLIAGYAQQGLGDAALYYYGQMQDEGLSPDAITFACILKACGSMGAVAKGEEIHVEVKRKGLLKQDYMLGNALVDMYAKCGDFAKAQDVFEELPILDAVPWTALIAGYNQHGLAEEALNCFKHMRDDGPFPNAITFICVLKSCGSIGAAEEGEEIHVEINRQGLMEKDIMLGTALVDMYAKCGIPSKAQQVFDVLPMWDVALWTVLIAGYTQLGLADEALSCFEKMQGEGLSPDEATYACILKACGSLGTTKKGEEIHGELSKKGFLTKNTMLGSAVVDMYSKCGLLAKAQEVFNELLVQDVVTWAALAGGYAQYGNITGVCKSVGKMIEHILPDAVLFLLLITVCSHTGLLDEGQIYLLAMNAVYCIIPTFEHYTCMIDLFGRAGHLEKAVDVMKKMPLCVSLPISPALLAACQKWLNVELGKWTFKHAVELDANYSALYICMRNICSAANMW